MQKHLHIHVVKVNFWWNELWNTTHLLYSRKNKFFDSVIKITFNTKWFIQYQFNRLHNCLRYKTWCFKLYLVDRCHCIPHLLNEQTTLAEFHFTSIHFLVAVRLEVLKLLATLHQCLHFWFHLADIEPSHCKLLIYLSILIHLNLIGTKSVHNWILHNWNNTQ